MVFNYARMRMVLELLVNEDLLPKLHTQKDEEAI